MIVNSNIDNISRFVCNKILPLVYDESLSYYEVLCKLTAKMNEMIDVFNGKSDYIIEQIVKDNLDKWVLGANYNASTETINLKVGE